MKLLLVGVGGVGCEFLILLEEYSRKNCIEIEVVIIDDDVVEESNLSRQRLYTSEDIGKPKVEVAANRLVDLKLTALKIKVELIDDFEFFEQFDVFVLAVDNLETRRWINSTVLQTRKSNKNWFLIDLGVQGFKFSLRTVKPGSACLECTLDLYLNGDEDYEIPVCSVFGKPRDLKDCVYWSSTRTTDLKEIYNLTIERAKEFCINFEDLSFSFINNLFKRSIPAVASVNSLLAAKGLELIFKSEDSLNFWMINLENGYYEFFTLLEINENCIICYNN